MARGGVRWRFWNASLGRAALGASSAGAAGEIMFSVRARYLAASSLSHVRTSALAALGAPRRPPPTVTRRFKELAGAREDVLLSRLVAGLVQLRYPH